MSFRSFQLCFESLHLQFDLVVLLADRFGNLITTLKPADVGASGLHCGDWKVVIADRELPLVKTYADVEPGEPVGLIGSAGTLEISIRNGNAMVDFGATRGTPIRLRRREG